MKIEKKGRETVITADPGFVIATWNKCRGGISHYHTYGEPVVERDEDFVNSLDNEKYWWYYIEVPYYENGRLIYQEECDWLKMRFRIIEYDAAYSGNSLRAADYSQQLSKKEYHVECQDYDEKDKFKWCHRYGWISDLKNAMRQLRDDINFFNDYKKIKKREDLMVLVRDEFVFNDPKDFSEIMEWAKKGSVNNIKGLQISSTNMYYSTDYGKCIDMLNAQYRIIKDEIAYRHYRDEEYVLTDWTSEEDKHEEPDRIHIRFDYTYKEPKDSISPYKYRQIIYHIEVHHSVLNLK